MATKLFKRTNDKNVFQRIIEHDDPPVADLGRDAAHVTYFGVEDPAMAMPEMQHASDSKHCRRCGAAYVYEAIYLGHMGRYRCPSCGQAHLRSDTVPGGTSSTVRDAPRGIVTLCETPGCDYAAAHVTRASGATSAE